MGKVTRPEENTPPRSLGARIKYLRTRKDESQGTLAEALFVKREYIAMIESDKRTPNNGLLIKIADRYGTSLDYLHGRTNEISERVDTSAATRFTGLSSKALNAVKFALMRGKRMMNNAYFFERIKGFIPDAKIPAEVDMNNLLNFAIESGALEELSVSLYGCLWSASVNGVVQRLDAPNYTENIGDVVRALEVVELQRDYAEAARREEWAASYRIFEMLKKIAESYLKTNLDSMKPYTAESARNEIERADEINSEYARQYNSLLFKYGDKAYSVMGISESHKVAVVRWMERTAIGESTEEEYVAWLDSQIKDGDTNA